jgi:hypothetical protein
MTSVVIVTPTETATNTNTGGTTTTAPGASLQTNAAADLSAKARHLAAGVGAVLAGAYFL